MLLIGTDDEKVKEPVARDGTEGRVLQLGDEFEGDDTIEC